MLTKRKQIWNLVDSLISDVIDRAEVLQGYTKTHLEQIDRDLSPRPIGTLENGAYKKFYRQASRQMIVTAILQKEFGR